MNRKIIQIEGNNNVTLQSNNSVIYSEIPKELTQIPLIHPEYVIGRENELSHLVNAFEENRVVSIIGMGGIGKTTLAILFVKKYLDHFNHIIWIRKDEGVDFFKSIAENEFLNANLFLKIDKNKDFVHQSNLIFQRINQLQGNNLIVIDNFSASIQEGELLKKINQDNWSILITSRQKFPFCYNINISQLTEENATELFKSIYPVSEDEEDLIPLLREVAFLPLAIKLIATRGNFLQLSIKELRNSLKTKIPTHQEVLEEEKDFKNLTAYSAIALTYKELDDNQKKLLIVASVLPPKDYYPEDISYIYDVFWSKSQSINEDLSELQRLSLVNKTSEDLISIHPLIRQFIFQEEKPKLEFGKIEEAEKIETAKEPIYSDVKELIAKGEIENALLKVKETLKDKSTRFYNEIILLLSRYKELTHKERLGIISQDNSGLIRNQINYNLILIIDELDQEEVNDLITETVKEKSPVKIFFSYSKKDNEMREELSKHMAVLRKNKLISTWHDLEIAPGEKWEDEIIENLNESDIILLLISSDFLSSDYCDKETKWALNLRKEKGTTIIPIILRPCIWEDSDISQMNVLPEKGIPISKWEDKDEAFANIVKGIKKIVIKKQEEKLPRTMRSRQ